MRSPSQDQLHSFEVSPELSQHPTSFGDTPSASQYYNNAPDFKPQQLVDSNQPTGISTAENNGQTTSSRTDTANRTPATNRTSRRRNTTNDHQEEEEGNGAGDGGDHESHKTRNTVPPSNRSIACPYRKRNYKRFNFPTHPKCTEGFSNMTAVKQHLKKKHMLSATELPSQDRQNFEYGINQATEKELVARDLMKKINTWEKLWVLLFNEDTNIPSPDHEPCHIFERYEVTDLVKQVVNHLFQHQASGHENFRFGPPTQDATDDAINHTLSTYITSRDPEGHMARSTKLKSRGKQRSEAVKTSGQTSASQGIIGHPNHTLRTLAPRTAASNPPGQPLRRPSAQETGPLSQGIARNTAPFDVAAHGGASYTIGSPASSLRRSAQLTPQIAHTPPGSLSAYPPVPEPWNANGHDLPQFQGYGPFGWTPNADDNIAEDLNEDDDRV